MKENDRFAAIMTQVLEWAEGGPGYWWCQDEAEQKVRSILDQPYYAAQMTDDEIAQDAIKVWQEAE
jgi:nitrous oxidase accessory protein NosD